MSTRTEFKDDVVLFNKDPLDIVEFENSQDEVFSVSELDPESWQDWHSEKLLNVYLSLIEYCEDVSMKNYMDGISFNTFCEFIQNPPRARRILETYDTRRMFSILQREFPDLCFDSFCTFLSDYSK